MREELRRCNYLGDIQSIYYLARLAICDEPTSYNSIVSLSSLNTSINVKVKPCILLFLELGYISEEDGMIKSTTTGRKVISNDFTDFVKEISSCTLDYLIDNQYIAPDAIIYDHAASVCQIKRSGVSFMAAVMRNLLLDTGALIEGDFGVYEVGNDYEKQFEEQVRKYRTKMSLEQLMEQHKRQEEQGRRAEEFVLEYEKRRLLWSENSKLVKQISDFDVSAGYDILSFNTTESPSYDRFIEVKSYSSTQAFFWSSNEMKVAREIKKHYFLYLVDMELYQSNGYEPTIICDPITNILNSEDWVIDTASVKVTKV